MLYIYLYMLYMLFIYVIRTHVQSCVSYGNEIR